MNVSQIVSVPASEGRLDGFRCECSCGLEMRSSLRTMLLVDICQHLAWHAKRG